MIGHGNLRETHRAREIMKTVYEILKPKFTATAVLVLIVAMAIACAPAGQPAQDDPKATPETHRHTGDRIPG